MIRLAAGRDLSRGDRTIKSNSIRPKDAARRVCYTREFPNATPTMWRGDFFFLLSRLIVKDFKIHYRNMPPGVMCGLIPFNFFHGALLLKLTTISLFICEKP
jgi:hypothetical protein